MRRHAVFTHRRHRLLRTRIPLAENVASAVVICILAGVLIWVLAQRDAYDPSARDWVPALSVDGGATVEIYNAPLRPWLEPGHSQLSGRSALGTLPESILDEEWQLVGRARTFDAGNLYEKINGEAEKFLKQGFLSLTYAVLRSTADGSEVAIELYDQGSVGGSMGVFSQHVSGDRPVQERTDVSFLMTSAGVLGRKGRFFFRVAGDRQNARITAKAAQLVQAFAGLAAEDEASPQALRILTQGMDVAEQNVAYQKTNVFQFNFATDFWFGRLDEDPSARLFIHVAETETDASALAQAILKEQSAHYRAMESTAEWTTLQHTFLSTFFAIAQRGRFVFGVDNLGDQRRVKALMARLWERTASE